MKSLAWAFALIIVGCSQESKIDQLTKQLDDPSEGMRLDAVKKLSKIKDPNVIYPLAKAMEDQSVSVSTRAGSALIDFGDKAVPPLIRIMRNPNILISDGALTPLVVIGEPAVNDVIRVLFSLCLVSLRVLILPNTYSRLLCRRLSTSSFVGLFLLR